MKIISFPTARRGELGEKEREPFQRGGSSGKRHFRREKSSSFGGKEEK